MKKIILSFALMSTQALALVSPFPSTVKGITIPNTSIVSGTNIIRGMAPLKKIDELINYGITDILIFKNQTRKEIDQEMEEILSYKDDQLQTMQIDFLWHKYPSYKLACEQTIDALRYIRTISESKDRKLFYHCTVGEDRTGFLSGIWKILKEKIPMKKAFYSEMCENGYEKGNPNKPYYVVKEIRNDLTPLFMYIAQLAQTKKISIGNLTKKYCKDTLPKSKIYKCENSSRLD